MLRTSGVCYLLREFFLRRKNLILCYHNPNAKAFRSHLKYLVKRYNIIPLDTLVTAIQRGDWSILPEKSLVLTIDDGFKENYQLLQVIQEFCIPITIYLCSHIMNTNRQFWWQSGPINHHKLKLCSNQERLSILKQRVNYEPEKEYEERQALNFQEIKEMEEFIDFEAHSSFHPILTQCDDKECLKEIQGAKTFLENTLNKNITHFAYPNGNYGDREEDYLMKSGYRSSVTMDDGWNDVHSNLFSLKRIWISDSASVFELAGRISGVWGYLGKFKKTFFSSQR